MPLHISLDESKLPVSFPLPLYSAEKIGTATDAAGEKYFLFAGFSSAVAAELKTKSLDPNDPELDANTSDRKRFGEGSYQDWYAKDRHPFALIHAESGALAAVAWYGPKALGRKSLKHLSAEEAAQNEAELDAGDWHTIVYRAYLPFRGRGIMTDFVRATIAIYLRRFPQARLWGSVQAFNAASLGLAAKLGFVEYDRSGDSVTMIRK